MVHKIQVGREALMRMKKSPIKSMWEVENGGSYLLLSDVHAIRWGVPKPSWGEVLAGKLEVSGLPGESPGGICIREKQTSLAHCPRNLLVSSRLPI